MARESTFNPIDETKINMSSKNHREYVTVSPKYGTLSFSIAYADRKKLDGAYIIVKVDVSKKAIFWKKIEGSTNLEKLNVARKLKVYDSNGARTCSISVKKILNAMGIKDSEKSFVQLPIKKYNSTFLSDELEYVQLVHKD